jgi:hypothetical protein
MIGHGWAVIESSSGRDASPTLLAKADGARRAARRPTPAGSQRPQDRERLTVSVRAALSALAVQARPRRQVRS